MKKWLTLLLAIIMTFAACAAACAEESEPVHIEILVGADSTGFYEAAIAQFEEQNPGIKVDINYIPGNTDDIKKALLTAMIAEDTNPDVFLTDVVWTGQFASAGWLKDLTGAFDDSVHGAGALESCMYDGKYFAMPVYTDIQLLIYRKDIISEDELPKTWDEMNALCEKYVGQNGIKYGWLWQGAQAECVVCNAVSFLGSNGAGFIENGEIVCNSPAAVEAVQYMYDTVYKYNVAPEDVLSYKPADCTPIFEQGVALFDIGWPGNYASMLVDDTSTVKDVVGITVMPVGASGTQPASCTGGWNVAVSAFTDQEEAAMKFAQFMAGSECQALRTKMTGCLPTIMALYDDEELLESVSYLTDVKECVAYGKSRPASSDYASLSTIIQEYLHKALTGMNTPQDAMDQLAEAMKPYV